MSFDTPPDRRGTHCAKWDMMETVYGVSPEDGLAMWVADMDFRAAPCIQDAISELQRHGVYGYLGDESDYRAAICWWMKERHGWSVDPASIFTTHGLVNATGICLDAWTEPGDGVLLFTPVYHAFARVIAAAGRKVVECPLALDGDRYRMDFDAYDALMTGGERMMILCSPHNPGGRVWTREELQSAADFAKRHDLIVVCDEIHHDLVYPGAKHLPLPLIDSTLNDRLVMLTSASKTFNIAGLHIGNVIIADPDLRRTLVERLAALGISPNSVGVEVVTAAYSPEGAKWVDELIAYLDENRRIFDEGVATIPGLRSMPLESTYLSWVDFSGTGMSEQEFQQRVLKEARIAVNLGATFGTGGEPHLRFNLGAPRSLIEEAVSRLRAAFSDLQ